MKAAQKEVRNLTRHAALHGGYRALKQRQRKKRHATQQGMQHCMVDKSLEAADHGHLQNLQRQHRSKHS